MLIRLPLLLLFSLTPTPPARAQQSTDSQPASTKPNPAHASSQPADRPDRLSARPFSFDELAFNLGFDADARRRRVQSFAGRSFSDRYEQTNKSRTFQESIGWNGSGDIGGARVARYQFDGRFGLSQEKYDESRPGPDLHTRPHGELLEYDGRIDFLPAGKISGSVWASQLDDRVPRPFLPSLDRRRERYGADIRYNDRTLPMRLSFEDAFESLSSSSFGLNDDEQRADRTLKYEAAWQPSDNQLLRLDYEYDDRREQYSGTRTRFDTIRNYLTLDHSLSFGRENRSRLETIARFQDESGDLARDVYEFAPRLRLQHSDSLASTFAAQYLNESFEGVSFETYRGDLGLTHSLGETLLSSAGLYTLQQQADGGGDTGQWGAIAGTSYSHDHSFGRFSASLNYNHALVRNDDYGYDGVVIGESLTLRDPLPAILTHQFVRPLSVVLMDADRRRTYLIGRDYIVLRLGPYTAIQRIANGNISNGQTLLATYTYDTARGLQLNRDRIDVRVQEAFKSGWTPYYAGTRQFESVDSDRFLTYRPRDTSRQRLGLNYRRPRWSAGAEYEYNDDSIDPYQALHLNADATLWQKSPHTLGTRATFSYFAFDGLRYGGESFSRLFATGGAGGPWLYSNRNSGGLDERDSLLLDLGLNYNCVLASHFDANFAALYRFEDDSLRGRTDGVDLSAGLNWRIGLFTASLEVEYDLLDLPSSHDRSFAAWIKLRRDFPVIQRRQ